MVQNGDGGHGRGRTLGASLDELNAVAGELRRDLEDFLDLVGHDCG